MNRRQAMSTLFSLTFAPFLGPFDHSWKRTSPRILVACVGGSGRRVYGELNHHNTSGLLQPMIVDTEAEMQSVVKSVSERRVILVAQFDAQFNHPLTWTMLRLARKQANCCHNFAAFIIYPYLTAKEMTMHIPPDQVPRWAYSMVEYVRVVNVDSSGKDNVQSRWQLRYFNTDITKVEKQAANDIAKTQIQKTGGETCQQKSSTSRPTLKLD